MSNLIYILASLSWNPISFEVWQDEDKNFWKFNSLDSPRQLISQLIATYNNSVDDIDEVSVFNVQGRKVASFKGEQKMNISNLSSGVYNVSAKLQDNRSLNKKIVLVD